MFKKKKAVSEDGPNFPWEESILQGLAHHHGSTQGWKNLAKAVLSGPLYLKIKWRAFSQDECRTQAEQNQAAQSPVSIIFGMLSRTADQFPTGLSRLPFLIHTRFRLGLWEWLHGKSEPPLQK